MIDLDPKWLELIRHIIRKHLPNVNVKAFGSRVTGNAKPFSDLDLVIFSEAPIPMKKMNELKLDLSNSDLPIMVDVIDWHLISEELRKRIEPECETLI